MQKSAHAGGFASKPPLLCILSVAPLPPMKAVWDAVVLDTNANPARSGTASTPGRAARASPFLSELIPVLAADDDYLAQSAKQGRVRMGVLTDGKHWLLRWPGAGEEVRLTRPYLVHSP